MTGELIGAESIGWNGTFYKTLLGPDASGGAMSIIDSVSPAGSGPPMHVHHREDEAFCIPSGEVEFCIAGDRFLAGPGQAVFVPRGAEHTFTVVGEKPCRHLLILTPGGFEGFFAEMAQGGFRLPQEMKQVQDAAKRYQVEFTGPPMAPEL